MSRLTKLLADAPEILANAGYSSEAAVAIPGVINLLPAHDAEIGERAKAELFDQLYAAAGTETMDAYRAVHPGPLTVLDIVAAIRQQSEKRETLLLADLERLKAAIEPLKRQRAEVADQIAASMCGQCQTGDPVWFDSKLSMYKHSFGTWCGGHLARSAFAALEKES